MFSVREIITGQWSDKGSRTRNEVAMVGFFDAIRSSSGFLLLSPLSWGRVPIPWLITLMPYLRNTSSRALPLLSVSSDDFQSQCFALKSPAIIQYLSSSSSESWSSSAQKDAI